MNKEVPTIAVQAAIADDWHKAHNLAQGYSDPIANWIHAVLHKIEGDAWNRKYWYARTDINGGNAKKYEDFADANIELCSIAAVLNAVQI